MKVPQKSLRLWPFDQHTETRAVHCATTLRLVTTSYFYAKYQANLQMMQLSTQSMPNIFRVPLNAESCATRSRRATRWRSLELGPKARDTQNNTCQWALVSCRVVYFLRFAFCATCTSGGYHFNEVGRFFQRSFSMRHSCLSESHLRQLAVAIKPTHHGKQRN